MKVCVFTGPTLGSDEVRAQLDALVLPPASQGDVFRAALGGCQVIGIIDGRFEEVPSVWHKEILWAMSQGVHVFGSASMGALRAAELAAFGMEGVGKIFAAYQEGVFEDDDEVAVVHGPAESGYRCLSEAMVNVRATLAAAVAAKIISETTAALLVSIAKSLHYSERTYPRILQHRSRQEASSLELDCLQNWLSTGSVDQKRLDAVAMLRVMRERLDAGIQPKRVDYVLEQTKYWNAAMRETEAPEPDLVAEDLSEDIRPFLRRILERSRGSSQP